MQYFLVILIIALCVSLSRTLVHYKKLDVGADGCKAPETNVELKVGEYVQDPQVCGIIRCEGKKGEGLIMYCQIPLPFAQCNEEYIDTEMSFPNCCWTCVTSKVCP